SRALQPCREVEQDESSIVEVDLVRIPVGGGLQFEDHATSLVLRERSGVHFLPGKVESSYGPASVVQEVHPILAGTRDGHRESQLVGPRTSPPECRDDPSGRIDLDQVGST